MNSISSSFSSSSSSSSSWYGFLDLLSTLQYNWRSGVMHFRNIITVPTYYLQSKIKEGKRGHSQRGTTKNTYSRKQNFSFCLLVNLVPSEGKTLTMNCNVVCYLKKKNKQAYSHFSWVGGYGRRDICYSPRLIQV